MSETTYSNRQSLDERFQDEKDVFLKYIVSELSREIDESWYPGAVIRISVSLTDWLTDNGYASCLRVLKYYRDNDLRVFTDDIMSLLCDFKVRGVDDGGKTFDTLSRNLVAGYPNEEASILIEVSEPDIK